MLAFLVMPQRCWLLASLVVMALSAVCSAESFAQSLIKEIIKEVLPKEVVFHENWKNKLIGTKNFSVDFILAGRKKRDVSHAQVMKIDGPRDELVSAARKKPASKTVERNSSDSMQSFELTSPTTPLFTLPEKRKGDDSTTRLPKTKPTRASTTPFNIDKWLKSVFTRKTKAPVNATTPTPPSSEESVTLPHRFLPKDSRTEPTMLPPKTNRSTEGKASPQDITTSKPLTSTNSTVDPSTNSRSNGTLFTLHSSTHGVTTPMITTTKQTTVSSSTVRILTSSTTESHTKNDTSTVKTTRKPWFKMTTKKPSNMGKKTTIMKSDSTTKPPAELMRTTMNRTEMTTATTMSATSATTKRPDPQKYKSAASNLCPIFVTLVLPFVLTYYTSLNV